MKYVGGRTSTTVPCSTPPRGPSKSSRYGVGVHSTAKTPNGTGVVTDRTTCHHARSASGEKKQPKTIAGGAAIVRLCSKRSRISGVGGTASSTQYNRNLSRIARNGRTSSSHVR